MARESYYAEKRDKVVVLIGQAQRKQSKAPTVRELAERCEVGVGTMHSYLVKLGKEGVVEWSRGRHHSLKLTESGFSELTTLGL